MVFVIIISSRNITNQIIKFMVHLIGMLIIPTIKWLSLEVLTLYNLKSRIFTCLMLITLILSICVSANFKLWRLPSFETKDWLLWSLKFIMSSLRNLIKPISISGNSVEQTIFLEWWCYFKDVLICHSWLKILFFL